MGRQCEKPTAERLGPGHRDRRFARPKHGPDCGLFTQALGDRCCTTPSAGAVSCIAASDRRTENRKPEISRLRARNRLYELHGVGRLPVGGDTRRRAAHAQRDPHQPARAHTPRATRQLARFVRAPARAGRRSGPTRALGSTRGSRRAPAVQTPTEPLLGPSPAQPARRSLVRIVVPELRPSTHADSAEMTSGQPPSSRILRPHARPSCPSLDQSSGPSPDPSLRPTRHRRAHPRVAQHPRSPARHRRPRYRAGMACPPDTRRVARPQ